jgi:hypothetical protein
MIDRNFYLEFARAARHWEVGLELVAQLAPQQHSLRARGARASNKQHVKPALVGICAEWLYVHYPFTHACAKSFIGQAIFL